MSVPRARWYAVNDRPVVLVVAHDGTTEALAFDPVSGALRPDRGAFARVSDVGPGKDVDQMEEDQFWHLVVELRRPIVGRLLGSSLPWAATGDGEVPYRAVVDDRTYEVRVNDFPAEPLYTLVAEGDELADLEDWPEAWTRPAGSPHT